MSRFRILSLAGPIDAAVKARHAGLPHHEREFWLDLLESYGL